MRTARKRGFVLFGLLPILACGPATPIVNRAAQALAATAVSSAVGPPRRTPEPSREPEALEVQPDGSSVDAIVAGLYASVSHGPEYEPNWDRMRKLFLPGALIVPPRPDDSEAVQPLSVEQFLDRIRGFIAARKQAGEPPGFTEREISRRTDCFGRLCQVFSTYEIVRSPRDPAPFRRGVQSFQLLDDGRRWWIASMVWDNERPGNPILPGPAPVESPSRQGV